MLTPGHPDTGSQTQMLTPGHLDPGSQTWMLTPGHLDPGSQTRTWIRTQVGEEMDKLVEGKEAEKKVIIEM
eukprot:6319320-Pyramimonas_sp.AAC.1